MARLLTLRAGAEVDSDDEPGVLLRGWERAAGRHHRPFALSRNGAVNALDSVRQADADAEAAAARAAGGPLLAV